jgi:syntaxin 1B/2/3
MSVNRLAELHGNNNSSGGYEMRPLLQSQGNGGGEDISTVEGFLAQIGHIKDSINVINQNVSRIQTYQSSMFQIADANELQRSKLAVEDLTNETQSIMTHIKQKLKEIEPNRAQSDLAMRKNTFSAVTKSFMSSIERHRQVAYEFQKAEGQQLERQIKIAKPNASPEEINDIITNAEQGSSSVFANQLLQSVNSEYRRQGAQNTLDAVQERHEDIRRLAKSVQELSTLFEEMQTLLEHQSQVLDTIESSAEQVTGDLEVGVKHVEKAAVTARATRRKKWICFGIFAVIIIIIIIVLLVKFIPRNSGNDNQQNNQNQ